MTIQTMNIFDAMVQSPWLSFFCIFTICWFTFLCFNRWMRSLNIKNCGWPPPHCDADGDPISKESEDEEL